MDGIQFRPIAFMLAVLQCIKCQKSYNSYTCHLHRPTRCVDWAQLRNYTFSQTTMNEWNALPTGWIHSSGIELLSTLTIRSRAFYMHVA